MNALQLNCIKDPLSGGVSTFPLYNAISIATSGTFTFNPVTDMSIPNNWYGACRVKTSNGANIVAIVQMRNTDCAGCTPPNKANAAAYEAMPANSQARTLAFPVIQKRLTDGSATVITVQNLNKDVPANVIFRYSQQGCTDPSCYSSVGPYSIPAGGSIAHNHRLAGSGSGTGQHNLPDGWTGTLIVYSLDQPIGGFAQLTNINNPSGDTTMAHNAIAR